MSLDERKTCRSVAGSWDVLAAGYLFILYGCFLKSSLGLVSDAMDVMELKLCAYIIQGKC